MTSSNLTSSQLKEVREAFDIFDADKSGKISAKEMRLVFKALEIEATDADIKSVIKEMDIDHDGEISFNEFVKVIGGHFYRKYDEKELKDAFLHFDKDRNGFITHDELKLVLNKLGKRYSNRKIEQMLKSADTDGNGKVSFDEFSKLLLKVKEAFKLFDKDNSGTVSSEEIVSVFKALNFQTNDKQIKAFIGEMDIDNDGEISFDEFARVLGSQYYRHRTNNEIKAAFKHLDQDKNGYITVDELKKMFKKFGKNYSDDQIEQMIKTIDSDGNRKISLDEFANLLID